MNLQQLEYIVAVDTHRHFGKAAESCHVAQATLSAMVKKLEEELGVMIFDRKSQPVVTTDCGREILEEARKTLLHARLMVEKARDIHNRIEGEARIGIIPTISASLLPLILQPISIKYPGLKLFFNELTTYELIEKLKAGELDIGIMATPLNLPELEETPLYYESMVLYGASISAAQSANTALQRLQGEPLWLLEEGYCMRLQTLSLCGADYPTPKNISFEGASFDTLIHLADAYGGFTMLPELYLPYLSEVQRTKVAIFDLPLPVREISLLVFRPYAKLRLSNRLAQEIANIVRPKLISAQLRNQDMQVLGWQDA